MNQDSYPAKISMKIETTNKAGQLEKLSTLMRAFGITMEKTHGYLSLLNRKKFILKIKLHIKDFNLLLRLIEKEAGGIEKKRRLEEKMIE